MQLRLEPAPDLRAPGDPLAIQRHRDLLARWASRTDGAPPAIDPERQLRQETDRMCRTGWRYWIPDTTRLARRLGPDAPDLLFAAGTPDLATPTVAVVGTRRPDAYGLAMARRIGGALARVGAVVASGGALGIDGAAHEAALEAGGRTIAVLGGGLGVPHPPSHRALFDRIAAAPGCCVLSEAPCLGPARPFSFPQRNRLLAALADAVVVVQAGVPSGALITAERARGLDVPVYAVPGDAWYERSAGTLALLRAGARVFACPGDLAAVPDLAGIQRAPWPRPGSRPLGLPSPWEPAPSAAPTALPPDADAAMAVIAGGARSVDEIVAVLPLHAGRVQAALLFLEIAGMVRVLPGGLVVPLREAR
jgi:DNA processing protein